MAQLPPKMPNMAHNWPSFPYQRMSSVTNNAATTMTLNSNIQPTWVDEFLDFTSVRRGDHRRSISDSVAFLDPPSMNISESNCFDRLDNDQLMSPFSDDISVAVPPTASSANPSTTSDQNSNLYSVPPTASSSYPSTTSDQNSNNDEKTNQQQNNETGEVESLCKNNESLQATQPSSASNGDTIIDPKRVKRTLANRQSAQRSRVRKLQYISELEQSVTTLQTEVSALSPRVAFLYRQRLILNVDNSALKQRIAALAQDKIFKDAHQEALNKEIERLRQVYNQRRLKKLNNSSSNNNNITAANEQ